MLKTLSYYECEFDNDGQKLLRTMAYSTSRHLLFNCHFATKMITKRGVIVLGIVMIVMLSVHGYSITLTDDSTCQSGSQCDSDGTKVNEMPICCPGGTIDYVGFGEGNQIRCLCPK
ncbi:hypothetical protein ACF0H5_007230 [Mactra antiquata]